MRPSHQHVPLEDSELAERASNAQGGCGTRFWDLAIEIMLAPLLLFMPMALGTSDAWSELVVFIVVTAMCICLIGKLIFQPGARFLWSPVYVPMVIFIGIAAAQLLPLPVGLVHAISPHTVELKKMLLSDAPNAEQALKRMTISFYPPGTRHDLRIVLAAAAIMIVVANTFRTPQQIRRLLMEICAIGGVVAIVALLQDLYKTDYIFGTFQLPAGSLATGGPFVNRSHFAQFMNLSIGCAIALLLVRLQEIFPRGDISPARLAKPWIDPEVWAVWLAIAVIVLGAISVAFSMSRAGLVTMVAAGVAVGVAIGFSGKSRGRGSFLTLLALIVFASVLYLGVDSITERFATAKDVATAGGRLQRVKDLWIVRRQFAIFGSGLGTHREFFPMFDTSTSQTQPYYVEVEFAQLMEEMGTVGVALVVIFILIIGAAFLRGVGRKHPIHGAALGLAFGLGAVFLHSFTDFGQHFLPDAGLSAVSCGLVLALSRSMRPVASEPREADPGQPSPPSSPRRSFPLFAGIAASIALAVIMGASLPNAISVTHAAAHARRADIQAAWLASRQWTGDDDAYVELLSEAQAASEIRPDDVYYRYLLNRYRWLLICRNEKGEQTPTPEMDDDWKGYARRIDDELEGCRVLCPSYGPALSLAGQIEYFYIDKPGGYDHIRLGARLSPHDPISCYIAGALEADKGDKAAALEHFNRAMSIDGSYGEAAIKFCLEHQHDPDLAVQVAQGKPNWLLYVADCLDQHESAMSPTTVPTTQSTALATTRPTQELSAKCREQAFALLKESTLQGDAPAGDLAMLADLYFTRREYQAAADLYRRALAINYAPGDWHLKLAKCLAETGRQGEAYHEALVALHNGADKGEVEKVLDQTREFADTQPAPSLPVPTTSPTTAPTTRPTALPATRPTTRSAR